MKARWLALALAALIAPMSASAATILQMNVDGGGNTAIPNGGFQVQAGEHQITFRIVPDSTDKMSAYVMNFVAAGGAQLKPLAPQQDPNDPGNPTLFTPFCVQNRAGADDNCSINPVVNGVVPNPTQFGTAEIFTANQSAGVNTLTFTLIMPIGSKLSLAGSSNVVLGNLSEVSADSLLGGTGNLTIISAIPEPGTVLLLGMGLSGLALAGRRRA